jgi:hypothetical protein
MELAVQSNKNATILVMGGFFFVIGLHQQLLRSVCRISRSIYASIAYPRSRHKTAQKVEAETPTLTLESLPYDVLLHVISYLDFFDVQSLQVVRNLSYSLCATD